MQPSMFNVRVPLADRDDVFLMNTFTDAQLIVSPDVADLLDRIGAATAFSRDGASARRSTTLAENGFLVESREAERRHSSEFFTDVREGQRPAARHRADDAAVQLRVRLLLPGRPRRLQQVRREDVARDGGAGRRRGSKRGSTRSRPRSFALTFFGGEPLLNLPVVYYLAERLSTALRRRAACSMVINIITNGLLLTPEVVDRLTPLRPARRQDHARRRPRHAQPHAAAARRPGHVRQDHREHPRRSPTSCRISIGGNFDEIVGRQLPGAARLPARAGVRRQARARSTSSRSSASRSRSSRRASSR